LVGLSQIKFQKKILPGRMKESFQNFAMKSMAKT